MMQCVNDNSHCNISLTRIWKVVCNVRAVFTWTLFTYYMHVQMRVFMFHLYLYIIHLDRMCSGQNGSVASIGRMAIKEIVQLKFGVCACAWACACESEIITQSFAHTLRFCLCLTLTRSNSFHPIHVGVGVCACVCVCWYVHISNISFKSSLVIQFVVLDRMNRLS